MNHENHFKQTHDCTPSLEVVFTTPEIEKRNSYQYTRIELLVGLDGHFKHSL